ncbi:hypothetical protein HAD_05810 [Hyphomonas adhaerens MHS-3]|uniref:Uncharacterized protein n=1 Tax=Hyphomonas adhaerens MHS-3 TaxID=1280949 RepID=A0A069E539_9PROT|nr:hypothetical protein [Hyphomonas adhaerens]KCZ85173.1 hypothetical protein HAD_05810 [Hyphomonas adhaerens MHS-3]
MIIAGWIVLGVTGFAFVLAAQMRMLISVSLRRALADKFGGDYRDPAFRAAVASSGKTDTPGEHLAWLIETYPAQLTQLRLARRVTYTAPMAILLSLAYLRFVVAAF